MEKCLFIYNPHSGKGKIVKNEEYIKNKLSQKFDVEVVRSQYAGNIGDTIFSRGNDFDIVVVAGGDGTLNETINAVARLNKRIKIGYIPTGTVNDVAHSLYIPRSIKKSVKNILEGQPFSHDILRVNDKFGIYVCCSGLFTSSSYDTQQDKKKKMGKVAYFLNGAKKVFSTPSVKLKLIYQGGIIEGNYAIMLIINSRYTGGMRVNKKAILNDGVVDIVLAESKKEVVNFCSILRVAFMFLRGIKEKSSKKIKHLKLDKFTIETSENTIINLDGEKIGKGSFDCQVIKEGVDIIVPKIHKLKKIIKTI